MSINDIPPLRDLPSGRLEARAHHLLAEIRDQSQPARIRDVRLPHLRIPARRLTVIALVTAALGIGTAVAATSTDWLRGEPAPSSVVSNFDSYAPQLGFNPEPGRAVLVAEDHDIRLYATSNTQGSYCLVTSTPWRPATLRDGGTCIPPEDAAASLIAGITAANNSTTSSGQTYVIAGRTADTQAHTIRFNDPVGNPITKTIGSSGFFVATLDTAEGACADGDWSTRFTTYDSNGQERDNTTITLAAVPPASPGVCSFGPPHS